MSRFDEALAGQLAGPHGPVGALVGAFMRLVNAGPNREAIRALDVRPDHHLLEIGFGPGAALAELARRAPRGQIDGLDRSRAMLRQASRRNARAIAAGRMRLAQGDFKALPYEDARFDGVLMVNVAYFFSSEGAELREVRRVLKPGGRAVVYVTDRATMTRWSFARTGHHRLFDADDLRQCMAAGGFAMDAIEVRPVRLPAGVSGLIAIAVGTA